MGRKRFTPEDIIGQLRTVEIVSGKGVSVPDACRKLGISLAACLPHSKS